ncbi:hypothetical protein CR513_04232, partial [Mucuna pruriens]
MRVFPTFKKSKLLPRGDGPFNVLKRINNNAYVLEMSYIYKGSHTFHDSNLRSNSFQESESEMTLDSIWKT